MAKRVAWLFPGQGSQHVGMGRDLFGKDDFADGLMAAASEASGRDLVKLCTRGPARLLSETQYLQPALTAFCLALWRRLAAASPQPAAVAGHSLGELPALVASGMADPHQVVQLAARRGALMSEAAATTPGSMIAITGVDVEGLTRAVSAFAQKGEVAVAAFNAPTQGTVSGDPELLLELAKQLGSAPGVSATALRVSGAWHSGHMAPAVTPFSREVAKLDLGQGKTAMLFNRHGRETGLNEVPERIARQLVNPVRWDLVMARFGELDITDFVEIGPGKVLRGLVRLNWDDPAVRVHNVSDLRSLERTLKQLQ